MWSYDFIERDKQQHKKKAFYARYTYREKSIMSRACFSAKYVHHRMMSNDRHKRKI